MRHLFFFICLFVSLGAQAQTGKAAERVAQIRARYAEAKELIAYNNSIPEARNQLTVNGSFMCPGTGHRDEVIDYYFTSHFDEESNQYVSTPYIIIRSYNVAVRKFYEELLYDEKGNLVFAFLSNDSFDPAVGRDEVRYYWGNQGEGLVHKTVKGEAEIDEVLVCRLANDLEEAFHRLMNREF